MPALTAANVIVTLTPEDIDRSPDGRIGMRTFPTLTFGNGTLTYPAGGIPMPALGKFGFDFAIKRAYIEQPADGFVYHFDRANNKLRIFQSGSHVHDLLAIGGITATEPVAIAGGDTFGKNAATNRTIAGAAYATKGGVVPVAAASLVELGAVAVPATVLNLELVGR